jgi:cbb3-type cytochrome oxidase maturation protein
MEVLILLIAFSLMLALGFLGAFIWATRNGQFDDDQTPAIRMLNDRKPVEKKD